MEILTENTKVMAKVMTKVKICGLTSPEDALAAQEAGADFLGFVNAENSKRFLTEDEISMIIAEITPKVPSVLVCHSLDTSDILNRFFASSCDILQQHAPLHPFEYEELKNQVPTLISNVSIPSELHGDIPDYLIERVSLLSQYSDYILFDTKVQTQNSTEIGGTGKTYDWDIAVELAEYAEVPVMIAGGLNPLNVSDAISKIKPFGVDVASGVESAPGVKDYSLIKEFVRAAKSA